MNRRNFLRNSSLAGLSLTAISLAACRDEPTRISVAPSPEGEDFSLNEATIETLQQQMQSGETSSQAITRLYLDRIRAIDQNGPKLHAVIELNPDALAIAAEMDSERKNNRVRSPLHGIPVLIKDNIDTADKMQTTAGALALAGNIAAKDAFIVSKLRAAGAVILGKTNLSEWANFRSGSSCSGWSSRGGQTRSPYLLTHNPCGSSSGSGVAVAANLCVVAVGTETDGSIVCPSSTCALVGIKPTVGLLSRSGIIPISHTQDTAGPMARTVRDAAILLGAMTGVDPDDRVTKNSEGKSFTDYTQYLDPNGLKGKRIGFEKKPQGDNHHLHALLARTKETLKQQGAEVVELEYLHRIQELGKHEYNVLKYEFKHGVNKYLAGANAKVKSLKEVIEFNKNNEDKAMPYFKQDTLEACEQLGGLDSREYREALAASHEGAKKILDEIIREHKLDALSGITMGPSCAIDLWYGDRWGSVFLTEPAATSGYPHITVPGGTVYGLPVGISFYGSAYSEPALIGMAYAFEQASRARTTPGFIPAYEAI